MPGRAYARDRSPPFGKLISRYSGLQRLPTLEAVSLNVSDAD